MSSRIDLLDLRPGSDSARGSPTPRMPSPRIEHFDGEVPPNLSPLDAFAMQSRALARQLEPRPGYFRSGSDQSQASRRAARSPDPNAHHAFAEEPKFRPQSQHPRISGLSILHSEGDDSDQTPIPGADSKGLAGEYFRSLRAESPEEDSSLQASSTSTLSTNTMPHIRTPSTSRESSYDSIPPPSVSATLAPASPIPPSLYYNNGQVESSDDDYTSSNGGSTWSKSRKLSTGSGISMPHSPMSPFVRSHPRSPSVSSEASNYLPRPSFNFSRPLSRSSTSMSLSAPSPVIPSDTPSQPNSNTSTPAIDQHSTNGIRRENKPAPIVLGQEPMSVVGEEPPSSAVSSYVYAKYSLPRGRMVSRNSLVFAGLQTPHFEWKEPLFQSSPTSEHHPSPEARSKEAPATIPFEAPTPKPRAPPEAALDVPTRVDPLDTVPTTVRQSHEIVRETEQHPVLQRSYSERLDDTMSVSTESNSTIRPITAKTAATTSPVVEQTAEEHVEKGIECHEKGALQESTYHLRIAAKQNHPTGMLLYALACRHGWGMRPNQKEGVQWLRKAVDSAGLEIGEDDEAPTGGKDAASRKARRAQFALGIYELGVSHLNGWGIEQDKVLALRCFEIASQWGDADALAEAGFCYAEGIGCKKNLKKAAHYYRLAEAKGMSMVGNSWIYKDKYMSDEDDSKRSRQSRGRDTGASEKNQRSKSRTRSIFQRKKSTA
ncbi:hypothetical protein TCE0_033r08098 [Talaromyces pinophilus]|uniref:Cell cycle inhibitor Nif1 n=1 Tax=Talaromyces pinophilus TaxID=128442 RepID=A0A6V8H9A2_TALPI|nr:hypothetical protein TCE0_033r08098 [Talaromyces pinophilus]